MMKSKPASKKKTIKGKAPAKKPTSRVTPEKKPASKYTPKRKNYASLYSEKIHLWCSALYHNPPDSDRLATLAATIYKEETMTPSEAVGVALALIDESRKAIRVIESIDEMFARERKADREKSFSYSEGVKKITGQKRKDRAVEIFQDIIMAQIKATYGGGEFIDPIIGHAPIEPLENLRKRLSATISVHEKRGFTGEEIKKFQEFLKN